MLSRRSRGRLALGEVVGLEWRDVDFTQRVLIVGRSQRQERVSLPKNGKPRRVDMAQKFTACLAGSKSLQAAEAALANWVQPRSRGHPVHARVRARYGRAGPRGGSLARWAICAPHEHASQTR